MQSFPTTPTTIPTVISVLDMDNERRIRREQLKQMNDPHDAAPFFPLTTGRKRTSSYVLPLLLDTVELPTKKRCLVVTPSSDDDHQQSWRPCSPCEDDASEDHSTCELQQLPSDYDDDKLAVDVVLQHQELVERSKNGTCSKWDKPISLRNLRPRRLDGLFSDVSGGSPLEWRPADASEFLPFMPL